MATTVNINPIADAYISLLNPNTYFGLSTACIQENLFNPMTSLEVY